MLKIDEKILLVLGSLDELGNLGIIKNESTTLLEPGQLARFDQMKSNKTVLSIQDINEILYYCNLVDHYDIDRLSELISDHLNTESVFWID